MLHRVLDAVADATVRVVVGHPQPVPPGVLLTRELPPGGGPVAAIAAGLAAVPFAPDDHLVAILAADQPLLTGAAITALRVAAAPSDVGALFVDAGNRPQLLCGMWRAAALRTALADLGDPAGQSVRRLLGHLRYVRVPPTANPPPWYDCDTPDQLAQAERWLNRTEAP